jgi:hypothetical protein
MMPRICRMGLLGACAIALGGCDSIPVLQFPYDASTTGGSGMDAAIGAADSQLDASSSIGDSSTDALDATDGLSESSVEGGCASSPPLGLSAVCCGFVWCVGMCDVDACATCETKNCTGASYCCDRAGMQGCKSGMGRCF